MVKEIQYTSVKEVLSRTLRHPLLQDINLEDAVQYVIDFVGLFGLDKMYDTKEVSLPIKDYRALLPCDLVSIEQIKDTKTHKCLISMTDTFTPDRDRMLSFKTQGRVLITSFKDGEVLIAYKAIPVDAEGMPMLPDNAVLLKCLDAYIKKEAFTPMFDTGKIQAGVLDRAEANYYALAKSLIAEFTTPSMSEMQALAHINTASIMHMTSFDDGFKMLGDRELIRRH